jgi:hypothetical protein
VSAREASVECHVDSVILRVESAHFDAADHRCVPAIEDFSDVDGEPFPSTFQTDEAPVEIDRCSCYEDRELGHPVLDVCCPIVIVIIDADLAERLENICESISRHQNVKVRVLSLFE